MKKLNGKRPAGMFLVLVVGVVGLVLAGEGWTVSGGPVDHAVIYVRTISYDTPIRIHEFSVEQAHMGKPKHRDVSEKVAQAAPHLLAADLLESLRHLGFTDVAMAGGDEPLPKGSLVLEGEFTLFDPGSQASRIMWGFGSGKSRVCLRGDVRDGSGTRMASFEHCRKGMGWGKSETELEKETRTLGGDIAAFLDGWAAGRYVH